MLRRWGILLAMLTLAAGMALTASSASTATTGFTLGGPIHLVGANRAVHSGIATRREARTGPATPPPPARTRACPPAGPNRLAPAAPAPSRPRSGSGSMATQAVQSSRPAARSTASAAPLLRLVRDVPERVRELLQHGPARRSLQRLGDLTGTSASSLDIADTTQGWSHATVANLGRGGPVLGRGHRRGSVLRCWRRHLAADQLRHGEHRRLDGRRGCPRQRRRDDPDHHDRQHRTRQGHRLLVERRGELQRDLAGQQLGPTRLFWQFAPSVTGPARRHSVRLRVTVVGRRYDGYP